MSSTGCPYPCTFCEQQRTDHGARSAKEVVAELFMLWKRHGVKEVEFFDPVITLERERVIELCQGILDKGIKIRWSARTRVDLVDEELLALMASAGCMRLYVGIESGNDDILNSYQKGFTVEQVIKGVRLIREAGIRVFGFFIIGAPEDTDETIRETIQLAKSLDLDYAQFSRLYAAPRTSLYRDFFSSQISSKTDYWGQLRPKSPVPPHVCERFTHEELESRIHKAYI